MEEDIPRKWEPKESGDSLIITDKADVKSKVVTRDKGHYTMMQWSIHQEDITIVNTYAPNIRAPTFSNGQVVETENQQGNIVLDHTVHQMNLKDIY